MSAPIKFGEEGSRARTTCAPMFAAPISGVAAGYRMYALANYIIVSL